MNFIESLAGLASLLGGIHGARLVESGFTDLILGWAVGIVIVFIVFRVLRIFTNNLDLINLLMRFSKKEEYLSQR